MRWRVRPQVPVGLPGLLGPQLIGHRKDFTVADVETTVAFWASCSHDFLPSALSMAFTMA